METAARRDGSRDRVLHVLAQRPGRTGSGTTLRALVREAAAVGWTQHAVVGVPVDDSEPEIGPLAPGQVHPLRFGGAGLPFPVPGMSDVMPYPSTRFRDLTTAQLDVYRSAWREHLGDVIARVKPDVIHTHHVWIVSALLAEIAPRVPCVVHVHSTGLRQMNLCPRLADEVREGCSRHERFVVLHEGQAEAVVQALGVPRQRIAVVGAGYDPEHFHARERSRDWRGQLLFVGKLSAAKGLPWLLDAFERLLAELPELRLHVVGAGHGAEGELLASRVARLAPRVVGHGVLSPAELGARMRQCDVCVLPSFHEGLPLVLVEAAACGCRVVATALEPVTRVLAPSLGRALTLVPPPELTARDRPCDAEAERFVAALAKALRSATASAAPAAATLGTFTWRAVFQRVERTWRAAIGD